jgi:hypothetical protein
MRVTATDRETAAGLVLIRFWVEPSSTERRADGLRARMFMVDLEDSAAERVETFAGGESVIDALRSFLASLTHDD